MYTAYFGFRENPFSSAADLRFFYTNSVSHKAYANLLHGVQQRKGFVVLTGAAGTGKTTLLRKAMEDFSPAVHCACLSHPTQSFQELLTWACAEWGLEGSRSLKTVQTLTDFLTTQRKKEQTVALLIDDAQELPAEVFHNLELLSNMETNSHNLLQIALVGQPELETQLSHPTLRQLKQRIPIWTRLERLTESEVEAFIHYRLQAVGCTRLDLFPPEALRRIAFYSHGLPRLINTICDNALLTTYRAHLKTVTPQTINEVVHQLRLTAAALKASEPRPAENAPAKAPRRAADRELAPGPRRLAWVGVALVVCLLGSVFLWQRQGSVELSRLEQTPHDQSRTASLKNNEGQNTQTAVHPQPLPGAGRQRNAHRLPTPALAEPKTGATALPLPAPHPAPPAQAGKEVERQIGAPKSPQDSSGGVQPAPVKTPVAEEATDTHLREEQARKRVRVRARLAQMGIPYTREAFINRIQNGDSHVVDLFLAAGMSPNAESKGDWIPLSIAAWNGHVSIVRALLERGADVHATDTGGTTALSYAEEAQNVKLMLLLKRAEKKK